ncbi:DUF563 domain-containing protein [Oceanicola sp. 22II-s10i]|uniref:glycosyltransferase family 61 protein n=1 Tax=Oceanicola sp. 22II-s10i TaxID=1317116 RepID=UPI001595C30C|nr:glycosyltransferase 61 family protein [Oceanicola sp. 22II-s10i]
MNAFSDITFTGMALVDEAILVAGRGLAHSINRPDGRPVDEAALIRKGRRIEPQLHDPAAFEGAERISGRWLFAGDYWPHFGHFLFESLARLWAVPQIAEPLDGLLFVAPRGAEWGEIDQNKFQRRMLDILGIDLPIRVLSAPARVERLYVPEQGCGMGELAAGTLSFRFFIREALGAGIAPAPDKKIYLTRTGYRLRRGGIFGEKTVEDLLAAEGYRILSPEAMTIEDQIAAYLGADKVISSDSSALHMTGFVGNEDQEVAILLRRLNGARDLLPQLRAFTGRDPLVVDRIDGYLVREGIRNTAWASFAELDLPGVGADLAGAGFIDQPDLWKPMPVRRRRRLLMQFRRRLNCEILEKGRNEFAWHIPDGSTLLADAA